MATPFVIENNVTDVAQPLGQFAGPFKRGADWFAGINDVTVAGLVQKLGVFKSTDNGLTWAAQDQGSEQSGIAKADICRVSDDVLRFAYNTGGTNDNRLIDFNMSTGVYGSPITGGDFPLSGAGLTPLLLVPLSNGHTVTVYERNSGGNPDIYVQEYDGATWGSRVVVKLHTGSGGTLVTPILLSITVDVNDVVHILRQDQHAGGHSYIIYNQYVGGVVSGDVAVFDYAGLGGSFGKGIYVPATDELIWPYIGVGAPKFSSVIRTTAAGGVFTLEGITDGGDTPVLPRIVASPDGTIQRFLCFVNDPTPVDHGQMIYFSYSGGGVWDPTPNLLWDEYLNPPTPPQSLFDEDFSPFSVNMYDNSGSMAVILGLFQDLPSPFCAIQYFLDLAAGGGGTTGPGTGYVFEFEKGVGRLATFVE